MLGNKSSFNQVLEKWNSQISKSIIESWGFPDEVAQSADPSSYVDQDTDTAPTYADVLAVARGLVDYGQDGSLDFEADPSCIKLRVTNDTVSGLMASYRDKLQSMQQSLS